MQLGSFVVLDAAKHSERTKKEKLMKKRIIVWELLFWVIAFLFATTVHGQNAPPPPATFTFGPTTACSAIVLNDDQNLTGTICPYQGDPSGGYGSFIDVPYQLGFLNNGYLAGCDPMVWGQKTFAQRPDGTTGDGTQAGDTFTQPAATTCPPSRASAPAVRSRARS